jgi:hypothetical protein
VLNSNQLKTKMKTPLFCLVGQSRDWSTAFAVESPRAAAVAYALNEWDNEAGWTVITSAITADEIPVTFASWKTDGIIN